MFYCALILGSVLGAWDTEIRSATFTKEVESSWDHPWNEVIAEPLRYGTTILRDVKRWYAQLGLRLLQRPRELDLEKIMVGLRKGKSIFRTSMYELNEKYLGNCKLSRSEEGLGWEARIKRNADREPPPLKAIKGFTLRSNIGFEVQNLHSVLHWSQEIKF